MNVVTIIKPRKHTLGQDLRELWEYRDLVVALGVRDLKVRYKQTTVGVAWAIIQPFVTMIVYTITFGRVAKVPSDGI
ncbi:MAG TPA: hypothetical protein VGI39_02960, partial [Polyangiaceae bacterium]